MKEPVKKKASGSGPLTPEPPVSDKLPASVWRILPVASMGPFMTQMDSTVVNVSLSNMRDALHSTIASAQWILSGYLLALALMLPLNGWLVDRIGAKRVYLVCFSGFTLASVFCGSVHSMNQLILARVLQGMAGGLLAPMAQFMVARVAGRHLARLIGYVTVPVLVAPILGPVVAGFILKYAGWPWLFYINLPVGILAVALAAFLLPSDEPVEQRRPFDFLGFILISPGLACMLYGLELVAHGNGVTMLLIGVAFLVGFVSDANRKKGAALLDLRLFNNQMFAKAATTQFLVNGLLYSGQFLIPLYLISGCNLAPAQAGWMLAPMGIGMLCANPTMGFLTDKFGYRYISMTGSIISVLGTLPFLWMIDHHLSPALLMLSLFARGVGQSAIGISTMAATYGSLPKDQLAAGTTAVNIVQRLGGPIATTSLAIAMSLLAIHFPVTGARAFFVPFLLFIGLQILVLLSASRLPVRIQHTR